MEARHSTHTPRAVQPLGPGPGPCRRAQVAWRERGVQVGPATPSVAHQPLRRSPSRPRSSALRVPPNPGRLPRHRAAPRCTFSGAGMPLLARLLRPPVKEAAPGQCRLVVVEESTEERGCGALLQLDAAARVWADPCSRKGARRGGTHPCAGIIPVDCRMWAQVSRGRGRGAWAGGGGMGPSWPASHREPDTGPGPAEECCRTHPCRLFGAGKWGGCRRV